MLGDAYQSGVFTGLLIKDIVILGITLWVLFKIYKAIAKRRSK